MTTAGQLEGLRIAVHFASIATWRSRRLGAASAPKMPGNVLVFFEVTS